MSEIKVNKLSPRSGTDVALGDSGDSFNVPSGAAIAVTGDLKSSILKDSTGAVVISKSGTAVTIGASGDTVSVASGATLEGAGLAWQSVQTTGFTASAGNGYPCNTTSAGFTVTLPATPSVGDQVQLVDYAGTFATNNIILTSSLNIEGGTDDKALTTNREGVTITYVDATQGWVASSGVNSGSQALDPAPYAVDFLVVAGGGGGGGQTGAGGGAGGYRLSTQTPPLGTVITVTVGDGGAGGMTGGQGSSSSISGSGLTTITSAGGGSGGGYSGPQIGGNGGSGGGGGYNTRAGGSGNTPSTSPSQGNNGGSSNATTWNCGGGGGAGAVGADGDAISTGGQGGNGTTSSITGSSVTYAGGGGGCRDVSITPGGTGGGGNGGSNSPSTPPTVGTVNTGGGGGGSRDNPSPYSGASGGKGVVILSMTSGNFSGTVTGSPVESISGANKILIFNGSGSYTT